MDNLQMDNLQKLQDLYCMMQLEGGEPIADQLMQQIAAEIEMIDRYGGGGAPAQCRAPMTPKAEEQRLNRLVTLWGELHTTSIVFTRVLKRTIGEIAAAAAAAPPQPQLRLLFAQLLRIYLVSQVTGNVDSTSKTPRPVLLQQELQSLQVSTETATATATVELQQSLWTLSAIGTEFVGICTRVSDLYD